MRTFVVFIVTIAAVAAIPNGPQRIVGGSLTTIFEYPEMVALLFSRGPSGHAHECGGSLLNQRAILTAAHCTIGYTAARWRSRVGSSFANSGGLVYATQDIVNHPGYNGRTLDNDIAIVRTITAITFSDAIQPARIAGTNYHVADNSVVWATGWGLTEFSAPSAQLRHVQIWTVNQAICRSRYALIRDVTDNMLCSGWLDVGGRDQCSNDSGGPLFHDKVVVGVCSWGRGCGSSYYPGVNARVSQYTSWIQQHANNV